MNDPPPSADPPAPLSPEAGGPGLPAYLEALASGQPTPGGGSAVAVTAALAAALGEMVCNLTLNRPTEPAVEGELRTAADRLATLRRRLLAAAAADETAYARYRDAAALPKSTAADRERRTAALQTALVAAADVPLAVAAACADLAATLETVARLGTRHALTDAEAGALLAEAALRGALLNVRGNARLLRDPALADTYLRRAAEVEAAGRAAADRVLTTASNRFGDR